ncbi:MAG: hypothetical protein QY321_03605 [Patescibacteria group bacterium]|nr:MAG: hypothetical protein QY321_03605 [Patescibacteria group bacterium]
MSFFSWKFSPALAWQLIAFLLGFITAWLIWSESARYFFSLFVR